MADRLATTPSEKALLVLDIILPLTYVFHFAYIVSWLMMRQILLAE